MSEKYIPKIYIENMEKGRTYYKEGDLDRASYHFSISLELEETPENLFYMGLISTQKTEHLEALNYFYRSIELDPDYGNP
ncbi:MAG: hypothetical protein KDK36_21770, partial [Leptospiraceae bacterium]|nr:hypothetical protein [Leptospiraceae bacterium]